MKNIIIILLFPLLVLSQEVVIKKLPDNINTNNAELNFVQKNDSTAYFTVVLEKDGMLESSIYKTNFKNGNWDKKKYSIYNSDIFNIANIFFLNEDRTFLTVCNSEMQDCRIVYIKHNNMQTLYDIPPLNSDQFFNTHAFIITHDFQNLIYFVSDRKGGFGGLDIWLSIIDNNGKFGVPINAGRNLNSPYDDITPFYNKYDSMMYFSSNRKNGVGGFDIYRSKGSLNLWSESENIDELNTINDELYITFYDMNNGYFSSNRKGAKFLSTEYCCNDIFSFEYLHPILDSIKTLSKIHDYLPLDLYFHNDQPDSNTINSSTKKTYKETYISYFMMKPDYEKYNPTLNSFFEDILQQNFNYLNIVLNMLISDLSKGNTMELQIRGYSSPLHNHQYNQNLSKRRISSFMNYILQFKNGFLKGYIYSKKLIITELPFGESNASSSVSDDANDIKNSIYSSGAMLERKIQIVDVILKE